MVVRSVSSATLEAEGDSAWTTFVRTCLKIKYRVGGMWLSGRVSVYNCSREALEAWLRKGAPASNQQRGAEKALGGRMLA